MVMRKKVIRYDVCLTLLIALLVIPTILLIVGSVASRWPWPDMMPGSINLRGYCKFMHTSGRFKVLMGSIGLSFVVSIITIIITMPAAKALGQMDFRGKKIIDMIVMFPLIAPTISIAMGVHILFLKVGLANTVLGVIIIHIFPCLPYSIRILQTAFRAMGETLQIQGRNLGGSRVKTFVLITLPMLSPALISAFGMVFIISYSQYLLTLLIGGGRVITLTVEMIPFLQSGDRVMGSTYSVVFMLTSIIVLFGVEKAVGKIYAVDKIYYY